MRPTLLIVDDEPDLIEILQHYLEELGISLESAPNGEAALARFSSEPPIDAMITDLSMPKMSGLELLRTLAREERSVPTVVLTAFGEDDMVDEARELGAIECFDKPIDFQGLLAACRRMLEL